jgi:hypothetical protein
VVLGVGGEDSAWADDQVVDVGAAVSDGDGVDEPPAWVLLGDLGELCGDLLFAVGTDAPGALVGVYAEGAG